LNIYNLLEKTVLEKLVGIIKKKKIDVLVLDSFKSYFTGINENSADDMRMVYTKVLKPLRDLGLTIILIAHTRKFKQEDTLTDKIERIRGSSEITNICDNVLILDRKGKELFAELSSEKNRYGIEAETIGIEYQFDNATASLVLVKTDKETWQKSHTKVYLDQVLNWFVDESTQVFKTKDLKDFLSKLDVKKQSVSMIAKRILDDLIELGKIKREKQGVYKVIIETQSTLK
jgi:RecA-family ATPase